MKKQLALEFTIHIVTKILIGKEKSISNPFKIFMYFHITKYVVLYLIGIWKTKYYFVQNITLFSKEYIPNIFSCCDIKPLTHTSNPFQRGSTDSFKGKNLKRCDNFEIPQLKYFKIRNYSASSIADGWQGVYIEIHFNNKSRLNCDLSNYGFIENETIKVEDDCKIKSKQLKHIFFQSQLNLISFLRFLRWIYYCGAHHYYWYQKKLLFLDLVWLVK